VVLVATPMDDDDDGGPVASTSAHLPSSTHTGDHVITAQPTDSSLRTPAQEATDDEIIRSVTHVKGSSI